VNDLKIVPIVVARVLGEPRFIVLERNLDLDGVLR
jgi:hypothetical protein